MQPISNPSSEFIWAVVAHHKAMEDVANTAEVQAEAQGLPPPMGNLYSPKEDGEHEPKNSFTFPLFYFFKSKHMATPKNYPRLSTLSLWEVASML